MAADPRRFSHTKSMVEFDRTDPTNLTNRPVTIFTPREDRLCPVRKDWYGSGHPIRDNPRKPLILSEFLKTEYDFGFHVRI